MLTLSFTGLLSIVLGITLVLLVLVVLRKQPPGTTDTLDRVMLMLFAACFAASLLYTGVLVMAGALAGFQTATLTIPIIINNGLKIAAIVFGWIKIVRNIFILKGGYYGRKQN